MSAPFTPTLMNKIAGVICVLSAAAALGGCAPMSNSRVNQAAPATYSANSASASLDVTGTGSTPGYDCPDSPNISPDYDYNFNGSGWFTACQNRDNHDSVLIHGKTVQSNTICVFPAQYIDAQHIYWKPDLSTGAPMYQCINLSTDTGAYANFQGVNYNALFIVESTVARDQMQLCLADGNFYNCPNYSYGVFR